MTNKDVEAQLEAAEVALAEPFARFELLIDELDDDAVRNGVSDSMPNALERLVGKLRAKMGDAAW